MSHFTRVGSGRGYAPELSGFWGMIPGTRSYEERAAEIRACDHGGLSEREVAELDPLARNEYHRAYGTDSVGFGIVDATNLLNLAVAAWPIARGVWHRLAR